MKVGELVSKLDAAASKGPRDSHVFDYLVVFEYRTFGDEDTTKIYTQHIAKVTVDHEKRWVVLS